MADHGFYAVDALIAASLIPAAQALHETLSANGCGGRAAIDVAPPQGKMLHLLARAIGAGRWDGFLLALVE